MSKVSEDLEELCEVPQEKRKRRNYLFLNLPCKMYGFAVMMFTAFIFGWVAKGWATHGEILETKVKYQELKLDAAMIREEALLERAAIREQIQKELALLNGDYHAELLHVKESFQQVLEEFDRKRSSELPEHEH